VLYQTAKSHIQSGKLGELVGARSVFSSAPRILPDWKRSRHSGGGVLLDVGSHHVDLVRFFFGQEICSVFAEVRSQRSECDSAVIQLQLADGFLVQSFFSLNTVDEDRFEIYGLSGKLAVDRFRSLKVEFTDPAHNFLPLKRLAHEVRSIFRSPYLINEFLAPSNEPSYKAALNRFVEAVQGKQPATPDFEDGYRVLTVIEAAEESARGKRTISLSNINDEDLAR
jgi:predicted dehydrogenase